MEDEENKEEIKIILVGSNGVGKSSIILRYINDQFNENLAPTINSKQTSKSVIFKEFKTKLTYDIWDTVGQEIFRGISKLFYNNSSIVILVYDITLEKSFIDIQDVWYEEVKNNTSPNVGKIEYLK